VRVLFVHHVLADRGSAQDMHHYARAAQALGHEVVLYGSPKSEHLFRYSRDVVSADAAIFIFEWTTDLQYGDRLDLTRLVSRVPRNRRVVIDCDGKYNDAIHVVGDYNHPDAAASRRWREVCDSLSDKICQPTYHPQQPNAHPFLFHGYSPKWEQPLNFQHKEFGMVYVGNNWFRWRALQRLLRAIEPVRREVGRIALVGQGWDTPAPWTSPTLIEDAYYSDPDYLNQLDVEVSPPVRFDQVVPAMGQGICSPVLLRPLFDHLGLVTCRTFETPAASTIPLFAQDAEPIRDVYGDAALELMLSEGEEVAAEQVLDVLRRPKYYAEVVQEIRRHLAELHSYEVRLHELIEIIES
jgi:hypothetical protein